MKKPIQGEGADAGLEELADRNTSYYELDPVTGALIPPRNFVVSVAAGPVSSPTKVRGLRALSKK